MRDKLKGLVVGLLIGSLVTGSMAYAANSKTITVLLQDLKFKLDGTFKPNASATGIIYKDTVYIPAKSLAGVTGKQVVFDQKTGTVSIDAPAIAVYKGGTVTQKELDVFTTAFSFFFEKAEEKDVLFSLKRLITLKLLSAKKEKALAQEANNDVSVAWEELIAKFGSEEELAAQLKSAKLSEADLKQFIKRYFLLTKELRSRVDSKAMQAEYDRQRKADSTAFVNVNVRQIQISLADSNTGAPIRTEEEALARAKEVQEKLKAGEDFTTLVNQYSDDPDTKNVGGLYENWSLIDFIEPFKKEAAKLPLNQISEPIQSNLGYHVLRVEARTLLSFEQVKDQLLYQLADKVYQDFLDNVVPSLIQSINIQT